MIKLLKPYNNRLEKDTAKGAAPLKRGVILEKILHAKKRVD